MRIILRLALYKKYTFLTALLTLITFCTYSQTEEDDWILATARLDTVNLENTKMYYVKKIPVGKNSLYTKVWVKELWAKNKIKGKTYIKGETMILYTFYCDDAEYEINSITHYNSKGDVIDTFDNPYPSLNRKSFLPPGSIGGYIQEIACSLKKETEKLKIKDAGIVTPPTTIDSGEDFFVGLPVEDEPVIYTKVEVDVEYPGNWRRFLENNLDGQVAVDAGASPGSYTVIIQFVVDQGGNVSDIKALTGIGHGMETEAMRVIRKSGKWKPAIKNGRAVKAYRKQPITFQVLEKDKKIYKK